MAALGEERRVSLSATIPRLLTQRYVTRVPKYYTIFTVLAVQLADAGRPAEGAGSGAVVSGGEPALFLRPLPSRERAGL